MRRKLLGVINVDFDATGQLLIMYSGFVKMLENKWEYGEAVHKLFMELKKACDSVRRKVLFNILIQFGIRIKLTRLIKMWLNETQSRVCVGKQLSMCLIRNCLKQGDVYRCFFQVCFRLRYLEGSGIPGWLIIK
jgi:hypothetical protein